MGRIIKLSRTSIYRGRCHYSVPESQGRHIAATDGFPLHVDRTLHMGWWSDHLARYAKERFENCCDILGTGDQGWASEIRQLDQETLLKFASAFHGRPLSHARVTYNYNVSSGHSVLFVEGIMIDKETLNARYGKFGERGEHAEEGIEPEEEAQADRQGCVETEG